MSTTDASHGTLRVEQNWDSELSVGCIRILPYSFSTQTLVIPKSEAFAMAVLGLPSNGPGLQIF
jgi:hypothetical protein